MAELIVKVKCSAWNLCTSLLPKLIGSHWSHDPHPSSRARMGNPSMCPEGADWEYWMNSRAGYPVSHGFIPGLGDVLQLHG